MTSVIEVKGDLLNFPADIICHQTNCASNYAMGLAKDIFDKFPAANTYKYRRRSQADLLGTNSYHKIIDFYVCNMYAQIYPGKYSGIGGGSRLMDSPKIRENAFKSCLNDLALFCLKNSLTDIAFPEKIACGLGGGDWKIYKQFLLDFAEDNPQFRVFIVNPYLK